MTPKQKETHVKAITDKLVSLGWSIDRWGNYKKTFESGKQFRAKIQKTSLRFEVKCADVWHNRVSDYFKNIDVVDSGLLIKGKVVG